MHNFKELKFWQKSVDLSVMIYKITSTFPSDEKFGLVSQLRRACVSIASNIAEGSSRNSNKELAHFLSIAIGSSYEVETQLIIANKLEYINDEKLNEVLNQLTEIQKMTFAFSKRIKENN
jgi:four helix bundle protein